MTQEQRNAMTEKVNELIAAPSCCAEAKAAANSWLEAAGTDQEDEKTAAMVEELKGDIGLAEHVVAMAKSDMAINMLGAERAAQMAAHAQSLIDAGEKYCDCPACKAARAIVELTGEKM